MPPTTWTGGSEPERRDAAEIKQLATDLYAGRFYVEQDVTALAMVYMPIGLGAFTGAPTSYLTKVGAIGEYLDKAGPRSINGRPMFFSCQIIHIDDWKQILATAKAIADAVEAV